MKFSCIRATSQKLHHIPNVTQKYYLLKFKVTFCILNSINPLTIFICKRKTIESAIDGISIGSPFSNLLQLNGTLFVYRILPALHPLCLHPMLTFFRQKILRAFLSRQFHGFRIRWREIRTKVVCLFESCVDYNKRSQYMRFVSAYQIDHKR